MKRRFTDGTHFMNHSRWKIIYIATSASVVAFIIWGALKHRSTEESAIQGAALLVASKANSNHPSESSKSLQTGDQLSDLVDWSKCSLSIKDTTRLAHAPMTPALARTLLERVKSGTKNINERACVSSAIIAILCGKGFTADAWDPVDENPGQLREFEIGAIFLSDRGPVSSLVDKLETITDS